jgi:hypothetical protein
MARGDTPINCLRARVLIGQISKSVERRVDCGSINRLRRIEQDEYTLSTLCDFRAVGVRNGTPECAFVVSTYKLPVDVDASFYAKVNIVTRANADIYISDNALLILYANGKKRLHRADIIDIDN